MGNETPALRERCRKWLDKRTMNAILRVGNELDDLVAFVIAERGKTADPELDGALPLCLYFQTDEDRKEFIAAVREAKPGMVMKEMP